MWGSAALAITVGALSAPSVAATATPSTSVEIPDSAYVLAPGETDLGAFPNDPVTFVLSMNVRNQAQADRLAKAISTPGSHEYGHYLSASEVRERFAPTDRDAAVVTRWLRDAGMTVAYDPSNHLFITAKGTVSAADKAFSTDIHKIDAADHSFQFSAPITPLFVPSSVNAVVSGFLEGINRPERLAKPMKAHGDSHDIAGRSTTRTKPATTSVRATARTASATHSAPPSDAFVNGTPCSAYWGEKVATGIPALPADYAANTPYAPCGYVPSQLQGAYGVSGLVSKGVTGKGVRVAVIDAYNSPTVLSDANTYATLHGGAAFTGNQFGEITPSSFRFGYDDTVNGNLCDEQGWYGEEALDVEAVHGMAPGAKVLYVGAASCFDSDLLTSLNTVIDGHKADIITNSWGDIGEDLDPVIAAAYHTVFVQAALEGIGVFFSSGDSGDEVDNAGFRTADYPASDPWVTAVGGTSIGISQQNNYLFETGWGTSKSSLVSGAWSPAAPGAHIYGGGGGTSQAFAQPWYQKGVVPGSISRYFGGAPGRAVPDIATLGDPSTGMLVGQTQTFPDGSVKYSEYRIGGTSLSSPVMAGIEALSDQAGGRHHGFANPAIYQLAGTKAYHDVVDPAKTLADVRVEFANGVDSSDGMLTSLRTFNQTQSLSTRPGYDDVTGVGSPNGLRYVYKLGHTSDSHDH
jgi:subtilase family serine protease